MQQVHMFQISNKDCKKLTYVHMLYIQFGDSHFLLHQTIWGFPFFNSICECKILNTVALKKRSKTTNLMTI